MEALPVPEPVAEPVEAVEGPAGQGGAADEKRERGEGRWRGLGRGAARFRAFPEGP